MMHMHCDSMAPTHKENAEESSSPLTFPAAVLVWWCCREQGCLWKRTKVESVSASAPSPSVLSQVQTKVATLSWMPTVLSRRKCVSTSKVRAQTEPGHVFLLIHAWHVLTERHLPSGCCCFLCTHNTAPVCLNGFKDPNLNGQANAF